jgi:hypothetical protein
MGVERSVSRWYARRQLILESIRTLEATLASISEASETQKAADEVTSVQVQLKEAQERLHSLGPCPQSLMG